MTATERRTTTLKMMATAHRATTTMMMTTVRLEKKWQ
jgi:hypothetical protein